jgi:hypothetical protein
MSVRTLAADVPAVVLPTSPFVIDAGLTPDDTALSGSMKSRSIRSMTARLSSSRTTVSAPGNENRASSSVITAMAAILVNRSVVEVVLNFVTSLGLPSPTHVADAPAGLRLDLHVEGHAPERRDPVGAELADDGPRTEKSRNADSSTCACAKSAEA